jgi:hypothetical protein
MAEDELSRSSRFKRIFPSPEMNKYAQLTSNSRNSYYHALCEAWEKKYSGNRRSGWEVLRRLDEMFKND